MSNIELTRLINTPYFSEPQEDIATLPFILTNNQWETISTSFLVDSVSLGASDQWKAFGPAGCRAWITHLEEKLTGNQSTVYCLSTKQLVCTAIKLLCEGVMGLERIPEQQRLAEFTQGDVDILKHWLSLDVDEKQAQSIFRCLAAHLWTIGLDSFNFLVRSPDDPLFNKSFQNWIEALNLFDVSYNQPSFN